MVDALLGLLLVVIVVGIVAFIAIKVLDLVPMQAGFKDVARLLIILIAVLIVLFRAWPILVGAI